VNESVEPVSGVRVSSGSRVLLGVAGVITLAGGAIVTAGGVFLAALGIWIAWLIARRQGKRLSRGMSWVAAVAAVELVLIAGVGWMAKKAPPGTMAQLRHTTDSAQANAPPPPAWLERIAPGSAARARAQRASTSTAFSVWALVVGAGILTGMISGLVGSVGWVGTLFLAYAITGRWIGAESGEVSFGDGQT
jgi:hypothetical protein